MKQIVTNILTVASFEVRKPEDLHGECEVAQVADQVIRGEQSYISKNNLTIRNLLDPNLVIMMNEAHCDRILSNQVSNAIKYSNPSGTVKISAEYTDDSVLLDVHDDGQGIGPEHLPRIFEEFYKADSSRHDRDSTGLGLALVKRIVQSYGGRITAESAGAGEGTTIRVILPVRTMIHHAG
ncbi:MAG: HAMP domain-containing histidine kinase [Methanospirillaceae archaeon]|nr:HAMP domain-containing histidine kinase [Methanospirillaceae archaeon]